MTEDTTVSNERRIEFVGIGLEALKWGLFNFILAIFIIPAAWGAGPFKKPSWPYRGSLPYRLC